MAPETTSPTSARSISPTGATRGRRVVRRGFTLVEMLVVIGIIVLLVGIAAPMITRAWRYGDRASTFNDLQAISTALEAYKQDHGDYPRVRTDTSIPLSPMSATQVRPNPPTGAQILCLALIAPAQAEESPGAIPPPGRRAIQDGADGPGFRIRGTQGKVYGPYLPPNRFKIGDPNNLNTPLTSPPPGRWLVATILDRYNKPILYYPAALTKPNLRVPGSPPPFVGQSELSLYDASDNQTGTFSPFDSNAGNAMRKLRVMLGDINNNGVIDVGETEAYTGPFILWSGGPDETFGPAPGLPLGTPAEIRKAVDKSDDITNFRQ